MQILEQIQNSSVDVNAHQRVKIDQIYANATSILIHAIKQYNDILCGVIHSNQSMYMFYAVMFYLVRENIKGYKNDIILKVSELFDGPAVMNVHTQRQLYIALNTYPKEQNDNMFTLRKQNEKFAQFIKNEFVLYFRNDFFSEIFTYVKHMIYSKIAGDGYHQLQQFNYVFVEQDSEYYIQQEDIFIDLIKQVAYYTKDVDFRYQNVPELFGQLDFNVQNILFRYTEVIQLVQHKQINIDMSLEDTAIPILKDYTKAIFIGFTVGQQCQLMRQAHDKVMCFDMQNLRSLRLNDTWTKMYITNHKIKFKDLLFLIQFFDYIVYRQYALTPSNVRDFITNHLSRVSTMDTHEYIHFVLQQAIQTQQDLKQMIKTVYIPQIQAKYLTMINTLNNHNLIQYQTINQQVEKPSLLQKIKFWQRNQDKNFNIFLLLDMFDTFGQLYFSNVLTSYVLPQSMFFQSHGSLTLADYINVGVTKTTNDDPIQQRQIQLFIDAFKYHKQLFIDKTTRTHRYKNIHWNKINMNISKLEVQKLLFDESELVTSSSPPDLRFEIRQSFYSNAKSTDNKVVHNAMLYMVIKQSK